MSPRSRTALARTKPFDVRRLELLEAGERIFLAKGITRASIDDIAAAAGVAKGTFYLYFASKEALVRALRERWVEFIQTRIAAGEGRVPRHDWPARLSAFIESGVRAYFEQVALHDVLFHDHDFHPTDEEGDTLSDNKVVRDLAEFLRAGTAARAWRLRDPKMTAVMLFHALHGGTDYVIAHKKRVDDKQALLIAQLDEFFKRALAIG